MLSWLQSPVMLRRWRMENAFKMLLFKGCTKNEMGHWPTVEHHRGSFTVSTWRKPETENFLRQFSKTCQICVVQHFCQLQHVGFHFVVSVHFSPWWPEELMILVDSTVWMSHHSFQVLKRVQAEKKSVFMLHSRGFRQTADRQHLLGGTGKTICWCRIVYKKCLIWFYRPALVH